MLADLRITRIFAAHRPDTVAIADRVLALSRTGVMEETSPAARTGSNTRQQSFNNSKGETYARAQQD
jgi:ABC-type bacteriocin/lantibiotic exporter with double-glycine peptidase domain